jgi:hypothetical protein
MEEDEEEPGQTRIVDSDVVKDELGIDDLSEDQ